MVKVPTTAIHWIEIWQPPEKKYVLHPPTGYFFLEKPLAEKQQIPIPYQVFSLTRPQTLDLPHGKHTNHYTANVVSYNNGIQLEVKSDLLGDVNSSLFKK